MAVEIKYDEKRKKIVVEIDFDPKKKYPDSKSGKTFMVGNNGADTKVAGAPDDNLRVGVNAYVRKPKEK